MEHNIIVDFGWLGVDLFFVISGALVSGIIFKEYLAEGRVNIKRFLIRRGFKIYPSFYFFMLFSIAFHYYQTGSLYEYKRILCEVFYLQTLGRLQ
jgi:peptidoglycan/LPS O-acetylase OafA/YrhL